MGDVVAFFVDARARILPVALVALVLGGLYLLVAPRVYEATALLQVDEKSTSPLPERGSDSARSVPVSLADAELEILRSRTVVGAVVDDLHLDIGVQPEQSSIARLLPWSRGDDPVGRDVGVAVDRLELPPAWKKQELQLVARPGGFDAVAPDGRLLGHGAVGAPLHFPGGTLLVSRLDAAPGSRFELVRRDRGEVIEALRKRLRVEDAGQKTGILEVAIEGPDPKRAAAVLDAIVRADVSNNMRLRSAQAASTLAVITQQLPKLKASADAAEAALSAYRARRGGGMDLREETASTLQRSAEVEKQLTLNELQRTEALGKFQPAHPLVVALSRKSAQLRREHAAIEKQLKALPETESESARLLRDAKVSTELYTVLLGKAQELQVQTSGKIGNVQVIDAASVGGRPVRPKRGITLLFAAVVGLAAGIGLELTRRSLHQGVDDPLVIERELGLPVHAVIPFSEAQRALEQPRQNGASKLRNVLALANPDDVAVEALRGLRTTLRGLQEFRRRVVVLTGPAPGAGKSFVAPNFALVLAAAGQRVLLVDADLRRGRLHEVFGVAASPGLTNVLRDGAPVHIHRMSHGLSFLASGDRPRNPSELLQSPAFEDQLARFAGEYDIVLIDTPPILAVTDAAIVGRLAGTVYLVLRAGRHPVAEISLADERLRQHGIEPRAAILNGLETRPRIAGAYRNYLYHYEYR